MRFGISPKVLKSVLDVATHAVGMCGGPSDLDQMESAISTTDQSAVPATTDSQTFKPTHKSRRRDRLTVFGAWVIGVLVAAEAVLIATVLIGPDPIWDFGMDFRYYRDLGVRWLTDGTYYLPRQLTGPYEVTLLGMVAPGPVDTLYPPSGLLLFVPFAVLPAIAWWAIPMTVTGYVLYRLRPAPWAWVVMLIMLSFPRAVGAYLFGNTDIWMTAAVAAGLIWGWPAVALTLKPSFAPLAIIGVKHRSWWIAAALGALSMLLMLPLWADYVVSVRNIRGLDLGYSIGSLPLVLAPVVAWVGRSRRVNELRDANSRPL